MTLPTPRSEADVEAFGSILSQPWLKASVSPSGSRWGRRIADVKLSQLPQNLLGQVMLISSDLKDLSSAPQEEGVVLVLFRWDSHDYKGWSQSFIVTLTFPDEQVYEVEIPPSSKIADWHSVYIPVKEGTPVRERENQKERVIPRVIFNLSAPVTKQLSQPVRRLLKNVRRMTDLIQCTSLFLVIEDEAGLMEVESSGIPNFFEAYKALRSGSYKADLLRYYLLYKYGGVYLDDKTFLRHSVDSEIFNDIFCQAQAQAIICTGRHTEIAFMAARQGSPIMLKALQTAISNVVERFYGNHRLSITGNIMFERVVSAGCSIPFKSLIKVGGGMCWGERIVVLSMTLSDERIMAGNDILWQRQAIPSADWPKPPTYYANLWNQSLVYVDRNPEFLLTHPPMTAEKKREIIAYSLTIFSIMCIGFLITRYPPIW